MRRRRRLARGAPLRRTGGLARTGPPARRTPLRSSRFAAASPAQRAKVAGRRCLVCGSQPVDPAHLISRARGGCDHPDCVVPLCRVHHRAFDRGEIDLLAQLEPSCRAELAHALIHVPLIALLQRVTATRWTPMTDTTERRAA